MICDRFPTRFTKHKLVVLELQEADKGAHAYNTRRIRDSCTLGKGRFEHNNSERATAPSIRTTNTHTLTHEYASLIATETSCALSLAEKELNAKLFIQAAVQQNYSSNKFRQRHRLL